MRNGWKWLLAGLCLLFAVLASRNLVAGPVPEETEAAQRPAVLALEPAQPARDPEIRRERSGTLCLTAGTLPPCPRRQDSNGVPLQRKSHRASCWQAFPPESLFG